MSEAEATLAHGEGSTTPRVVVVPTVDASSPVADLVRHALASSVERLFVHERTALVGDDPEGVHQARVATRRLRSDLATFEPFLDAGRCRSLRRELSWLGDALGAARDLDVLQAGLRRSARQLPAVDLDAAGRVVDRLDPERADVRVLLVEAIRSDRYAALIELLLEAVASPFVVPDVARAPAAEVTGGLMRRPWALLRAACDRLEPGSDDDALHAARIRAKRARYAAEALAPAFGRPARKFASRAEVLQGVLGEHQDAVMAIAWLRSCAASAPPAEAFAAGRLAGPETRAREEARASWPAAWSELRRRRWRFWE